MNLDDLKSSTKYCHVTSVEIAKKILETKTFFLSRYDRMNDLAEAAQHEDEEGSVFVLCFSNSVVLNIPMFYLYGGIDGKGCRIQLTDGKLREILNTCKVYEVSKSGTRSENEIPDSDYEILYDWVYYISSDGYFEHHHDKVRGRFKNFDVAMNTLRQSNRHYFIKSPIWKYEKEFRVVLRFNQKTSYDRVALVFDIKEKDRGVTIAFGPETTIDEYKKLEKEFKGYGASKTVATAEGYHISMKLVNKNKEILGQY